MNCAEISANIVAAVCGKQALGGTGASVWLINYNDIDRALTTVVGSVVTALVLKATKKAYKFTSLENAIVADHSLSKGPWFNSWNHNVPLTIFTKSQVSKDFINKAPGLKLVAIVENREIGTATVGGVVTTGEVKYEVYGFDAGLECVESVGTTDVADGVVYTAKFATGDKAKETEIPKSYFAATLVATETALAGITAP